jgi:hypothetical protein
LRAREAGTSLTYRFFREKFDSGCVERDTVFIINFYSTIYENYEILIHGLLSHYGSCQKH